MKTHVTRFIRRSAESKKQLLVPLIMLGLLLPGVSLTLNASLFTSRPELSTSLTPTLTLNTVDMNGAPVTGYVVLYLAGLPVASDYSPASFTLIRGITYVVESDGYGSCLFDHWQDTGNRNNQRSVSITSDTTLTSVLNCGNAVRTTTSTSTTSTSASTSSNTSTATTATSVTSTAITTSSATASSMGITVYAHRIPASYWDPCFATTCTNPHASCDTSCTGPGATMYFALYNSAGTFVAGGFADEHGFTFTGLSPGATYYVYPDDCDSCHGSTHDVVFQHWGDGNTTRPMAVVVGESLDAWYSCTNECSGG